VLHLSRNSHQALYVSYKRSGSALSVLLYFTLANVTKVTHFTMKYQHIYCTKEAIFFDENLSMSYHSLAFYNYSSIPLKPYFKGFCWGISNILPKP